VQLGVIILPTDPWPETAATAQRLERLGYDHLWIYDHLSWRRYRDRPWHATHPWLAGLAVATETIGLGTMVSNPNIRHPLLLAKDALSIDHLSGGRFSLGLGAGGSGFDAEALGQPAHRPAEKMDRLVELTDLVDGLLRGTVTDHEGPWYTVNGARMLPGCVQEPRLPLLIAGNGPRGIDLAARVGDGWISATAVTVADPRPHPDTALRLAAERLDRLDQRCADHGRDPAALRRIHLVPDSPDPLTGLDAFVDHVEQHRALGFTDVVFHHPRPDDPVWRADPAIVGEIAGRLLEPRP
jgi:alkanesulfonate monooxygenase SsuD/methylene tetrahydromethanopterin reductase-like flavin-dependent oxidoreductase (luciferase family)